MENKNFEEARNTYRELLTQEDMNENAYLGLGLSYELEIDTVAAIKLHEEALQVNEGFNQIRENLVGLYSIPGQWDRISVSHPAQYNIFAVHLPPGQ